MHIPVVQGTIERRLLVNFRADPEVVGKFLPPPFEPLLVGGFSIVGICLIRLSGVRPRFLPSACGLSSENAAHRIAVRWTHQGRASEGVYIPRRDSSSCANALLGGRFFPGVHHPARFNVHERGGRYEIDMTSRDGRASLSVHGRSASTWSANSIFASLGEASRFFERGSLGYSATRRPGTYDGLELRCGTWEVHPVEVESVRSSFFEDTAIFPPGSVAFDCALAMHNISHEWHGRGTMCCADPAIASA